MARDRSDGESQVPTWSTESAGRLTRTVDTVTPAFDPPDDDPAADLHQWDTWQVRNRHGEVVTIDGWQVLISLTSSADLLPGKRHDVATLRYFYSRNGRDWELGGVVFDGEPLGQRQWAGSAVYDDGELYVFYTAAGDEDAEELDYSQRIAVGHGGSVTTSAESVEITGPWRHEILLEPDGEYYETQAQSRGMIYTFRDPWPFQDPESDELYLLFEANTPVPEGSERCEGDPQRQEFNGCIGIAHSSTGDLLDWEFEPPLFDAVCVNQELERPHVVYKDGQYYLFCSSHFHTFAPGLHGFDGLYGFVANSLHGEYRPLNGAGLVATNPANRPYQSYSWMAFSHGDELLVQSFLNYPDFGGTSLDDIGDLPEDEQIHRFGGTLGPTLRLSLEGETTRIRGFLDHWHLPTPDEELPALDAEWPPEDLVLETDDQPPAGDTSGQSEYYR
jgi:levansucrase